MKILITGASGLVGQQMLENFFESGITDIRVLTRNKNQEFAFPVEVYQWDPAQAQLGPEALEGVDTIIHLAGESVAEGRWTQNKKDKILNSRVDSTRLLMDTIRTMDKPPRKFISASAIGIYGNCGDEALDSQSKVGDGFLADVCKQWEELTLNHGIEGLESQLIRVGIVLAKNGGALKKMLPPFKMGVAGNLGNGKQYMSWIHIEDLVEQFKFLLEGNGTQQIYNGVSPGALTNAAFTKTLGKILRRPTLFPVPSFALKLIFGEMSQILLNSQRVIPNEFVKDGFKFKYQDLKSALENILEHDLNGERVLKVYQYIDMPLDKVFPFFSNENNLEKITPEYLKFKVLGKNTPTLTKGTLIDYKLKVHGISLSWKSRINEFISPKVFVDEQLNGPYSKWVHTHNFFEMPHGTLIKDHVVYKVPLGALGDIVAGLFVKKDLDKIFGYRKKVIKDIFKEE
ncbi:MAG: TIGR01777 family oxidoreductase [Bacteriovoracaceae bacterium]